jgi:hypothetical protein
MGKSRRVKRNIEKYTKRYDATESNVAGVTRSVFSVVLAALFAIIVPIVSFVFAANVIFRVPDLYNFDVGMTLGASDGIELKIKQDAIGDLISDYMLHKTDYFQLRAEYQGREKPVFSINDGMNMSSYRKLLDQSFIVFCLSLIAGVAIFIFLCRTRRKRALRNGFRVSVLLCLLAVFGMGELVRNDDMRTMILRVVLNVRQQSNDVLPSLFGANYRLEVLVAVVVIAMVLVIVTHSVVRVFTKQSKMF